jgi:FixJ family two-component response regulator
MADRSRVCVVDDDISVRESLPDLLDALGFEACAYVSAEDFLASGQADECACLLLDVGLPGMSGPDLQRELTKRGHDIPIVFITANNDESLRQRVLDRGAIDCLVKPYSAVALQQALEKATAAD